MAASMNAHVKCLRHLISEIRLASSHKDLRNSNLMGYIFSQYKKFKVTDQQLCKAQDEMVCLANNYVTYLQSVRKYNELLQSYQSAGERSVESTANMVGFKLPHDPK
uniref:Protein FMC1 homolog n=2 Tax=Lygus hesperus TaxID=30085 RepID=A0A0K8SMV8_LYGHE